GITENQTVLVEIVGEIGANGGVTPFQPQILQRTVLHHVGNIGIAFPLLSFTATAGDFDVVTGDIAGHEGQAGYADTGEVVVVAHLPGAFLDVGEVVDLHEVDQERVAAGDVRERVIAAHSLV